MKKYIFILGQNPELSQQEIITIINREKGKIDTISNTYIIANTSKEPEELINILGGSIKVVEYKESIKDLSNIDIFNYIKDSLEDDKKNNFGFSIYNSNDKEYNNILKTSLNLKRELKNKGYKVRLVTSKENVLSSVIITKNKLINKELIIIKDNNEYIIGITKAVQDFAKYGHIDMDRPERDSRSGMLPPKLAQIMINLSGLDNNKIILDPFCGSGTILQEAILLNYKNIYGSDNSEKAVSDSIKNTTWLKKEYNLNNNINIQKINSTNLSKYFDKESIDLIVTEPFMGDARLIQRTNNIQDLEQIKNELQTLYINTFKEFKKILSPNGRIVFIFPIINNIYTLNKKIISDIGFKLKKSDIKSDNLSQNNNIIYSRENQKVKREITIWEN